MTVRHRVFTRMWGVAVLAHLAGNWRYGDIAPEPTLIGWLLLIAGLLATAALVAPRRWMMLLLGLVGPATALLEAPVLGNHWVLAGFVSLAYVFTAGSWHRFEPAARLILLVFYAFAAFAKLNTGFLDPATSCGVVYANQWLHGFGLPLVSPRSGFGWATAWGSALVELAVPVLIVFRRTRPWGVILAIAFHGLISLDLNQHFFDFTAVLMPLFVLFLSDSYFERFEKVGEMLRPTTRRLVSGVVAVAGIAVTVSSVTPLGPGSAWWLVRGSFVWWIPFLILVVWSAVGSLRPVSLDWKLGPVAVGLGVLVFLNGLTPYLELKTAYGWNMYSNLVTVDGESNHLLVRSTFPLREGHQGLVTVVESDDPGLQIYADEGYQLPWPSFRSFLADHPETSVTFERHGVPFEVARAGGTDFGAPVPWWWRWMPLRAVHGEQPDRCQIGFLPAL